MGEDIHENDRTIFKYLDPKRNDMLSEFSKSQINELLMYLDRYYLEYRDNVGICQDVTFGIEIEMENMVNWSLSQFDKFQQGINEIVGNDKWITKNDWTLFRGREISSEILIDSDNNWNKIKKVCEFSRNCAEIGTKTAAHVHVGSQVFGNNPLYLYRFCKMWSIYENVIYRFGYGEYLSHRVGILNYAKASAGLLNDRLPILKDKVNSEFYDMILAIKPSNISFDSFKYYGISFWRLYCDNNFDRYDDYNKINNGCTYEYRAPNGTHDEIIWQNLVLFIVKLMLYCKSDNFNDDILDSRKIQIVSMFDNLDAYSDIYLDQAIELCDMIFDNNIDKLYFLRQYFKSFEVVNKPFVKARKFTVTK